MQLEVVGSRKRQRARQLADVVVNAGTSTIAITDTSSTSKTFAGGGMTYNNLTFTVAGSTGGLIITGSNTFNNFSFSDASNARTLTLTHGTTNTINGAFSVKGTATKLMTITSDTAATATLSKPYGVVSCDYIDPIWSTATGGATWYAGANSTDGGNNSGWIFAAGKVGNFFDFM